MQKPTADECLDILAQLWTRAAPSNIQSALGKFDTEEPGWHTRLPTILRGSPDRASEVAYMLYWWRRCREALRSAGRLPAGKAGT